MICRFGELGSLEETVSQRFDYDAEGRLTPSTPYGGLTQTGSGTSVSSKQMMISTITMALGDADGDWKAAEDILGLLLSRTFYFFSLERSLLSAENCVAYGLQGKTPILQAKKENFAKNLPGSCVAYEVNNFLCDPDNRSDHLTRAKTEEIFTFQDDLLHIPVFPPGTGGSRH